MNSVGPTITTNTSIAISLATTAHTTASIHNIGDFAAQISFDAGLTWYILPAHQTRNFKVAFTEDDVRVASYTLDCPTTIHCEFDPITGIGSWTIS